MKKPSKRTLIYYALCEAIDAQTANIEAYGVDSPESASAAFLRDCYREILVKDYGVSKTPMEELADQNKGKGLNLFSYVSGKGVPDGN